MITYMERLFLGVGVIAGVLLGWWLWGRTPPQVITPSARAEIRTPEGLVVAREGATLPNPMTKPVKGLKPRDTGRITATLKPRPAQDPKVPEIDCPPVDIRYTVSEEKDGSHRLTFESDGATLEASHYQVDLSSRGKQYLNRLGATVAYSPSRQGVVYGGAYVRDLSALPISISIGVDRDRVMLGAYLRF